MTSRPSRTSRLLGFKGIQLRSSAVDRFADKPAELKALLQQHRLTMAVLSSGNLRLDPAFEAEDLAKHSKNAAVRASDRWTYIQILDEPPKGKTLGADDYKRMGRLLTELGKRTADAGIPLVYHNHMNGMSQPPEGTAAIMEATDPRHVRLLLDVAHYQQGGGDPVKAVARMQDRIQVVHFKDVVSPAPSVEGAPPQPCPVRRAWAGYRQPQSCSVGAGSNQLSGLGHHRAGRDAGQVAHAERLRRDQPRLRRARAPPAALKARVNQKGDIMIPRSSSVLAFGLLGRCSCLRSLLKSPNAGMFRRQRRPDPQKAGLTAEETRAGWKMLFDGKSLNGWRGYKKTDSAGTRWSVEDGVLDARKERWQGHARFARSDLDRDVRSFRARLGMAYRARRQQRDEVARVGGHGLCHRPRVPDDRRRAPPGCEGGAQAADVARSTMCCAASNRPLKPAGEWNLSRVSVRGMTVEHWLNGTKVLSYELGSPALQGGRREKASSRTLRGSATLQKGHILVQDHGDQVWYRDRSRSGRSRQERG